MVNLRACERHGAYWSDSSVFPRCTVSCRCDKPSAHQQPTFVNGSPLVWWHVEQWSYALAPRTLETENTEFTMMPHPPRPQPQRRGKVARASFPLSVRRIRSHSLGHCSPSIPGAPYMHHRRSTTRSASDSIARYTWVTSSRHGPGSDARKLLQSDSMSWSR